MPLLLRAVVGYHHVSNWDYIMEGRRQELAGTYLNTSPRTSLASLALASVADARPQTRKNTAKSLDGVAVKDAG